jgi:hypothetical protein
MHLAQALGVAVNEIPVPSKKSSIHGLHFEDAMKLGYSISEYHPHGNNPNYTVMVTKEDQSKVYTNITREHLATALGIKVDQLQSQSFRSKSRSPTREPLGRSPTKPTLQSPSKGHSLASLVQSGAHLVSMKKVFGNIDFRMKNISIRFK